MAAPTGRRGLPWVLIIAAGVIALDQVSKWWAEQSLAGRPPVQLLGEWLQLTFVRNPGGAFSIATQYTWVFTIVAVSVAVAIVIYSRGVRSAWWLLALGVLLGGAIGNLVDRLVQPPGLGRGHVVDWIELPNWPVFNVADMAVVGGAITVVVLSLLGVDPKGSADDTRAPDRDGVAAEPTRE
jgi:signal peptidase II